MIKEKHYFTLYDSKDDDSDGTDIEETRYPYYDDNLDLAGYSADWRDSKTGRFVAIVDFNADGDEGRVRYCPHCESFGFKYKLGAKMLKHGEKPAPDHDQWLSCYECGNTFPRHETFVNSKIKDSVETTDNPFENENTILGVDSRADQRRKGRKPKSKRLKTEENEDPDIQREIDRHGSDNVHIMQ
jgi:hypothetical protein